MAITPLTRTALKLVEMPTEILRKVLSGWMGEVNAALNSLQTQVSAAGGGASTANIYTSVVAQSLTEATPVRINFPTSERSDLGGVTNPSTAWRYTAATAGYHDIQATVSIHRSSFGAIDAYISVYKNGAELCMGERVYGTMDNFNRTVGTSVYLVVGDYIEIWVYQGSGTGVPAATLYTVASRNRVCIVKLP